MSGAEENEFRRLARWMAVCGWINIGVSVAELVNLLAAYNVAPLFSAVIRVVIGSLCLQGARAFRTVADTDGADQRNLVVAFGKLRALFLLNAIVIVVGLAAVAALVVLGVLLNQARR